MRAQGAWGTDAVELTSPLSAETTAERRQRGERLRLRTARAGGREGEVVRLRLRTAQAGGREGEVVGRSHILEPRRPTFEF